MKMKIDNEQKINTLLPYNPRLRCTNKELIMRYPWEWYFTLTFEKNIHPEEANKRLRFFINEINKSLYGTHWARYGNTVEYVQATELQYRGVIHFHIMLHTPDRELTENQLLQYHKTWHKIAGVSDLNYLEAIRNLEAVSRYCSKYVARSGEYGIDFHFRNYKSY
jgi:hypothetical protein